jgi:hypothetical protein
MSLRRVTRRCDPRRHVHRPGRRVEPFHARLVADAELVRILPADSVRVDIGESVGVECFSEVDEADDGTEVKLRYLAINATISTQWES